MKQQSRVLLGTLIVLVIGAMAFYQSGEEAAGTGHNHDQPRRVAQQPAEMAVPSIDELHNRVRGGLTLGRPETVPVPEPPSGSTLPDTTPRSTWRYETDGN